jgi:hypothetical protein
VDVHLSSCHATLPMPGPPLGDCDPNSAGVFAGQQLDLGDRSRRGREGEYDMVGPSTCPLLQVRYPVNPF